MPGYKDNFINQNCIKYNCDYDSECQLYGAVDPNRYCSVSGDCLCKHDYEEDTYHDRVCKRNKLDYCSKDIDCSGPNRLCVDGECHCAPNYKFVKREGRCVFKSCDSITDCSNTWDNMRVCRLGSCVCYGDDYKENWSNGRKCEFQYTVWNWSWMWVFIVFPVIFFVSLVTLIARYRRRQMVGQPVYVYRS